MDMHYKTDEAFQTRIAHLEFLTHFMMEVCHAVTAADVLDLTAKRLSAFTRALAVFVSEFDPSTRTLTVRRVETENAHLAKAKSIWGKDIPGHQESLTTERIELMLLSKAAQLESVADLTFGSMPRAIATAIERAFRIKAVFGISLQFGGKLLGSAALIAGPDTIIPDIEFLNSFGETAAAGLWAKGEHEKLAEREKLFRTLAEGVPLGLYRTTPDGRIIYSNPALNHLLGYGSFESIVRRNLEDGGLDASYPRRVFKQRLESAGKITGLEAVWIRRDGQKIVLRENARVVQDETGRPVYYDGTLEDITEKKTAEDEIRENAAALKMLNEVAVDLATAPPYVDIYALVAEKLRICTGAAATGVTIYDGEARELVIKYAALAGQSMNRVNKILGRGMVGMRIPLSPADHKKMLFEVIAKFEDVTDLTFGFIPPPTGALLQKIVGIGAFFGVALHLEDELIGSAIAAVPPGSPPVSYEILHTFAHMAASAIKRRWTENELRRSEERYRELNDLLPLLVYETDFEGNLLYVNKLGRIILGIDENEDFAGLGINIFSWLSPEDHEPARKGMARTASGKTAEGETMAYTIKTADGSLLTFDCRGELITREGAPVGIRGVGLDITEQLQREEARADEHEQNLLAVRGLQTHIASLQKDHARLERQAAEMGVYKALFEDEFEENAEAQIVTDGGGSVLAANCAARGLWGWGDEAYRGQSLVSLVPVKIRDRIQTLLLAAETGGRQEAVESDLRVGRGQGIKLVVKVLPEKARDLAFYILWRFISPA